MGSLWSADNRGKIKLLDSKIDFYDEWVTTGKRPPVKAAERAGAALPSSPKAKSRQGAKP